MAKHSEHSIQKIRIAAARAAADPRTTERVALGLPCRSQLLRERIVAELRRVGIEPLKTADEIEANQPQPARAAGGGR